MTKVFVHGNPETTAVWSELVPALRRRGVEDIELLSPPGFGAEVPAGFGSTTRSTWLAMTGARATHTPWRPTAPIYYDRGQPIAQGWFIPPTNGIRPRRSGSGWATGKPRSLRS